MDSWKRDETGCAAAAAAAAAFAACAAAAAFAAAAAAVASAEEVGAASRTRPGGDMDVGLPPRIDVVGVVCTGVNVVVRHSFLSAGRASATFKLDDVAAVWSDGSDVLVEPAVLKPSASRRSSGVCSSVDDSGPGDVCGLSTELRENAR